MTLFPALIRSILGFASRSAETRREARHAAYLSEASDLNDLERRMQELAVSPGSSHQASWMPF